LRLDRDARPAGRVDRRAAVALDGGGRELRRLARAIARGLDRDRPESRGVGIEAENDLAAPLLDQPRESVTERDDAFGCPAEGASARNGLPVGRTVLRQV
jgi:hypothetical protein